jgi:RNA polymerase sigma-70 factor (ECF subfamily)
MISSTERVWHDLHGDLRAFIGSRINDTHAAEDILQDVFTRIHTHASTLRDETRLQSWIYQITRNAIIDHYRSQKSTLELPDTLVAPDDDHEVDPASALAPCIKEMVEELPDKYREALRLTEYEGLTQIEAAQRLGLPLSTFKSRVQRARDQIRSTLLECCHFEFDRLNRIINYYPHCDSCTEAQSEPCDAGCG